jgi:hypothetical protein
VSRSPSADPPVEITLSIPQSVRERLDILLWDPVRKKPKYGAFSKLVTKLLRAWIKKQKE